jgi:hypothetical protein
MGFFGRVFSGIRTGARSILEGIFGRSQPAPAEDFPEELPEDIPEPQEPEGLDIEELPEEPEPEQDYYEDIYGDLPEQEADYYADELEGYTDEFGSIKQEYMDMLDTMTENGHIGEFQNDEQRREFLRFLQSDFWGSKKQYIYTAGTMQAVQTAIQNGAKVSDLEAAFNDWMLFEDDDTDIEDIWAGWTKA